MSKPAVSRGYRRFVARAVAALIPGFLFAVGGARADGVGFRDIAFEVDGERLTAALWYPAAGPSGRTVVGPFAMAATSQADAPASSACRAADRRRSYGTSAGSE